MIAETRRRLGPITIIVNNAGVGSADDGEIWEQAYDAFRYTMAVNLEAPFLLSQEASRDMREAGYGRIVMVASTAGQIGSPRNISYTTSKHALLGLMRAAAQDVGHVRRHLQRRAARLGATRRWRTARPSGTRSARARRADEIWAVARPALPARQRARAGGDRRGDRVPLHATRRAA